MDEITLSGNTTVWEVLDGVIHNWQISVMETDLTPASIDDIQGGTKEENAATMRRLFEGEQGPIRDVVLLNSGAALLAGDKVESINQGIELATEILEGGEPLRKLDALVELSQRLGQELA